MRITGKYIQPEARPKFNDVRRLTGRESGNLYRGKRARHILGGDFNCHSWGNGFAEWLGPHGIWTLTNPGLPTFSRGNSLAKFLYVPGDESPDTFLIEYKQQRDNLGDEGYYPGETGDGEGVGTQCPVVLNIPGRPDRSSPLIRRKKQISLAQKSGGR